MLVRHVITWGQDRVGKVGFHGTSEIMPSWRQIDRSLLVIIMTSTSDPNQFLCVVSWHTIREQTIKEMSGAWDYAHECARIFEMNLTLIKSLVDFTRIPILVAIHLFPPLPAQSWWPIGPVQDHSSVGNSIINSAQILGLPTSFCPSCNNSSPFHMLLGFLCVFRKPFLC